MITLKLRNMKTEDAIKKLNAYYGMDCLSVEHRGDDTHFEINLPHEMTKSLLNGGKAGHIYGVLQYNGFSCIQLYIENDKIETL